MIWHILLGLIIGNLMGFGIAVLIYRPVLDELDEADQNVRECKGEIAKLKRILDEQRRALDEITKYGCEPSREIISSVRKQSSN